MKISKKKKGDWLIIAPFAVLCVLHVFQCTGGEGTVQVQASS